MDKKNINVDGKYNFFEFEDKSDKNTYSIDTLKTETKTMEEEEEFKNFLKIIKEGKETLELWGELKTYY